MFFSIKWSFIVHGFYYYKIHEHNWNNNYVHYLQANNFILIIEIGINVALIVFRGLEMLEKNYLKKLYCDILSSGYDEKYAKLCLVYATRLKDNHLPVVFDVSHFALLLGCKESLIFKMIYSYKSFYSVYNIPKKSGGERTLHIPSLELKYIQRWIVDNILINIKTSVFSTGFGKGNSILNNAKYHLNKECVVNMDIKNFFPSISFSRVFKIFYYYGYTKEMSFIFASLCTYENELPQGSPASPWISNIACLKLDKRLSNLATSYNSVYTRYADDITFSGSKYIKKITDVASQIISEEGFIVNEKKTRIVFQNGRQEVTGLIVNNEKVRVNKKYKKKVKQEIYYCQKYGVSDHLKHINCDYNFYKEHLYGKVFFIQMIERDEGNRLLEELGKIEWDY